MKPLEDRLDTIERLLRDILKEKKTSETWVKAETIMKLTGWDAEGMRRARNNGFVKFRNQKGFWYSVESIPKIFIKRENV